MGIQEYDAASNEVGMEIDEDDEDDDEGPILVDEIVEMNWMNQTEFSMMK